MLRPACPRSASSSLRGIALGIVSLFLGLTIYISPAPAQRREVLIGTFDTRVEPSVRPGSHAESLQRQRVAWGDQARRRQLNNEFRMAAGDRIFFGSGGAELGARARQVLAAQASWLKRHPDLNVMIEAHADDPGSSGVNDELALQRAEAVRQRLVEEGVESARIRVAGFGRDRRIAICPDAMCATQNRRAVTIVGAWVQTPSALDPTARSSLGASRPD